MRVRVRVRVRVVRVRVWVRGGGGSFALIAVRFEDAAVFGDDGGLGLRLGSGVGELSSTVPSDHLRELSTQVVRFASGLSTEPG